MRSSSILQRKSEGDEVDLEAGIITSNSSQNLEDLEEGVRREMFSSANEHKSSVHTGAVEVPAAAITVIDSKLQLCCMRHCTSPGHKKPPKT